MDNDSIFFSLFVKKSLMRKLTIVGTFCVVAQLAIAQNVTSKKLDTIVIKKQMAVVDNVLKISKENLIENSGHNLAELLEKEAGISLRQVGATVAKPVIEGLANNRILILNNGIKLESQDWSDDHAPEISLGVPQNISIVKGAQGVRYGAGALGGVILLSPKPLRFGKELSGSAVLSGNSNSGKISSGVYIERGLGRYWAWRLQANTQYSGDYKTRDYYVNNTGSRELNYSAELGYRRENFQSKLYYSGYRSDLGIFYGAATTSRYDFEARLEYGRPTEYEGFTYKITAPKHNVWHHFVKSETEFRLGDFNQVSLIYNYQNNHRREFDIRRMDRTRIPTQDMKLTSHFGEALWKNHFFKDVEFQLGMSYLRKENINISGTGVVPTIPNYVMNNYASFFIVELKKEKWLAEFGGRFDFRNINSLGYNAFGELYGSKKKFSSFSYSAGVHYEFLKNLEYTAHIGYAWRNPEPYELYINGKQHGIPIYYIGDEQMKSERGLKFVNKITYKNPQFSADLSVFVQPIENFIYNIPLYHDNGDRLYIDLFSGPSAAFQFVQTDAFFRGGDLSISLPITRNLSYQSNLSLVYANDRKTGGYLPQIPPFNLNQSIKWNIPNSVFEKAYIKLEHQYYAKQNRFDARLDLVADSPSSYHLFGVKIASEWKIDTKRSVNFYLGVENLTNQLYKNYTDRLRYFIHGKGMDIQFKTEFNF